MTIIQENRDNVKAIHENKNQSVGICLIMPAWRTMFQFRRLD